MKSLVLAAACLSLAADTQKPAVAAPAASKTTKAQDISHLLGALGWPEANSETARKQLATAAKDPKLAGYPAAYWKDYNEAASPAAFEKLLQPVFDQAYSHEEIKALVKLFASAEMKKVMEKHPEGLRLLLDKHPALLKAKSYDAFSKHLTEVGKELAKKHGIKSEPKK